MTQTVLAVRLGLTFQQIQKYERGSNRISASKLHETAAALEQPIEWFFEGLEPSGAPSASPMLEALLRMDDVTTLAEMWPNLPPSIRRSIIDLMRVHPNVRPSPPRG